MNGCYTVIYRDRQGECFHCEAPILEDIDEDGTPRNIRRLEQQRITDLEAENRELREKYDGAVRECQRLTDLLAMREEE